MLFWLLVRFIKISALTCQGLDPIGPLQVVRDEVVAHLEHVEHLVVHHIVGVVVEVPDAAVEAVAVLASAGPRGVRHGAPGHQELLGVSRIL